MNRSVILTCAVTGAGDTTDKSDKVPVTPKQIAEAAIEAAMAGASVVHCHVRNPETGKGARDVALYREVVDRIRESEHDIVINLTAGMGGDLEFEAGENPLNFVPAGTDFVGPIERLAHVEALLPEMCTLDCGTLNFGDGNTVTVHTPDMLRRGARRIQALGVKPELEVFDTGNLWFARRLCEEGLIDGPPLFQLCLGIPYGAEATTTHMKAMVDALPGDAIWAGFGISRMQMPMVAQAILLGGHCRVGLEDNLYLEKGVFATNGQLVEKARRLIDLMDATVKTPQETRNFLGLRKRGQGPALADTDRKQAR